MFFIRLFLGNTWKKIGGHHARLREKENSKQVYFVLNYDLNFAICQYRLKIAAQDMRCILIKRKP